MPNRLTSNRLTRMALHVGLPVTRLRGALPPGAIERIEARVAQGDPSHTGCVRVAIESALPTGFLRAGVGPRERAIKVFSDLAVWDTEDNNGVLLYVLLADRAVEIVADRAAARAIGADRWQALCERLAQRYRARDFVDGTMQAIDEINQLLQQAFPVSARQDRPDATPAHARD